MKIKVYKIREEAKLPIRSHATDAGMDLFFCPVRSEQRVFIEALGSKILETGLKIEVPKNHMLEIKNKSGIASQKQLIVGACVIDPGYDGEIFVNLQNIGTTTRVIEPGQKIAQAVLVPIVIPEIREVKDEIYPSPTSRGSGSLGSTGEY